MIDIQFVRDNQELVHTKSQEKGYSVDIDRLLRLDNERRELVGQVESLRARRNDNASKMSGGKPEQDVIDEGKQLKIELIERET